MTTGGTLTEGTGGPGKTSGLLPSSKGIFTVGRGQMDDFLRCPWHVKLERRDDLQRRPR